MPLAMQCQYPSQYGTSPSAPLSPSDSTGSSKMPPAGYFSPHHAVTALPQQPRQKGRPRKRKPKDIEAMTASLGEYQFLFFFGKFYDSESLSDLPGGEHMQINSSASELLLLDGHAHALIDGGRLEVRAACQAERMEYLLNGGFALQGGSVFVFTLCEV